MAETTDKKGRELVRDLELFLGNSVHSSDGYYDWLLRTPEGEIHSEVKTAKSERNTYFSVNDLDAIKRMFEDPGYRLCFCQLEPAPLVLRCHGALLFHLMKWIPSSEANEELHSLGEVARVDCNMTEPSTCFGRRAIQSHPYKARARTGPSSSRPPVKP